MELTQEQAQAVLRAVDWYGSKDRAPVFRLFGPAGVGKTTLARIIADRIAPDGGVRYAALAGKAAHRLRQKGADPASTIHSLIYQMIPGSKPPRFTLNHESRLRDTGLLILDEVSMVGKRIAKDLLSFNTPILVLGDPAQLPPVGDDVGYFTEAEPDVLLTEVHRFALDSPITALATEVREWASGLESVPRLAVKGGSGGLGLVPLDKAMGFDQIIVALNSTRWHYLEKIRAELGRPGGVPVAGDRIMVLRNDHELGIFNGQQFDVLDATENPLASNEYDMRLRDEEGNERWLEGVLGLGFQGGRLAEDEAKEWAGNRGGVAATFANVITCHKGQGSEWGRVLVRDERRDPRFRNLSIDPRAWTYTAVTRAQDQVVVAGSVR